MRKLTVFMALALVGQFLVAPFATAATVVDVTGVGRFYDGIPDPTFGQGHALFAVNVINGQGTFEIRHNWFSGFDNQAIQGVATSVTESGNTVTIRGTCEAVNSNRNPEGPQPCLMTVLDADSVAANAPGSDRIGFSYPGLIIGSLANSPSLTLRGAIDVGDIAVTSV